jgi:glycosyltransferase involved in cell wall biosynthesis
MLMPGLRLVHTFHFGNYPHTRPRIIWMERVFSRCADRLYAVGEAQKQQVRRVHHLPDRRIDTIWNGVVLPAPGRHVRPENPRPVIGTIATFIEQKGLGDLLRVARRLKDEGREARFVVVGDGPLRPELEALRSDLGLDELVAFPGWVTNAASVALPSFDVFFQPSLWEAMSVVVLEAMASAKPVVATAVGETPRVIEDGVSGLLVRPRDTDGMVSALARLLDNPTLRQRLGTAARCRVESSFTVEHMTRAYERAYLDLCQ